MTRVLAPYPAALSALTSRIEAIQSEALGRALTDGECMVRITVDGAALVPVSEYRVRPPQDARIGFTGRLPNLIRAS